MFFSKSDSAKTNELEARIKTLEAEIKALKKTNERYKEALKFYADPSTWNDPKKYRDDHDKTVFTLDASSSEVDNGAVAMKALAAD